LAAFLHGNAERVFGLVRKWDLSRAGGSARRRASADGFWLTPVVI
jgi:hypothetical protein